MPQLHVAITPTPNIAERDDRVAALNEVWLAIRISIQERGARFKQDGAPEKELHTGWFQVREGAANKKTIFFEKSLADTLVKYQQEAAIELGQRAAPTEVDAGPEFAMSPEEYGAV